MAEIGKLGMSLNRKATADRLKVPESAQRALLRRPPQRAALFELPHDAASDSTSQYGYGSQSQPRQQPLLRAQASSNEERAADVNDIELEPLSGRKGPAQIFKGSLPRPTLDTQGQGANTNSLRLSPAHITEQSQERAQETARREFEDSLAD